MSMSQLPATPCTLRIFPSALSLEQRTATRGHMGEDALTFTALWQLLGHHAGHRSMPPMQARLLLRAWLADSPLQAHAGAGASDAWGVRLVHHALLELRMAGVTAAHLQAHRLSPETAAVAAVLQRYETMLQDAHAYDAADVQRQAVLDVAQGRLPAALQAVREVEVLAGQDLIGARLDLLNALAARGVRVTVRLAWDAGRPGAFAWPEAIAHGVESRGHPTLQVRFDDRVGGGPLAAMRAAQWTTQQAPTPAVQVQQVSAGCEHGRHVAWQVSQWLADGVPAHAVAVVAADATMMEEVRAAFASARLPLASRTAPRLGDAPLLRRLRAAWALPEQGFLRDAVLDVWQVSGTPITTPQGVWGPDRVAWEVRRAGWRSARLESVATALLRTTPETVVRAVAAQLQPWLDSWAAIPAQGDGDAFVAATQQSLQRLARVEDAAALTALHGLLASLQGVAGPPWRKAEWLDWLRLCADEILLPVAPQPAGAVRLLRPEEIVGARLSRVVFAGANLGVFPRQREADAVLTDAVRAEVNRALGPRLWQYGPLSGRGALPAEARDLWLWQELLLSCQDALHVTVTTAPGEAAMGHSEVVDELLRSLGGPPAAGAPPSYARGGAWPQAWRGLASLHPAPPAPFAEAVQAAQSSAPVARLPIAAQAQVQRWLLDQVQSTSRLDVLGMCAFRFFAAGLLGLNQDDVPTLSANAREQGSAAHAGLHRVYRDLMQRGGLRQARLLSDDTLARAAEVFWAQAEAVLQEVHVHPLLREATLQQAWLAVQAQLRRDLAGRTAAEPRALEYAFDDRDGAAAPELEVWDAAHGRCVRVRGSIDRVDLDSDTGTLWTLDYKRTVSSRSAHRHFQLGLYSAVAQRDLAPEVGAVNAAWIALADGRRTLAEGLCGETQAALQHVREHLWQRLDRVLQGDMTPDPDGVDMCARCDFRSLCRHDAAAAELDALAGDA